MSAPLLQLADNYLTEPTRWKGDLLMRQYEVQADLIKFFFDLIVKVNTFHYAVTGAILSFYFSKGSPAWRPMLWLPVVLSVGMGLVGFYGAWALQATKKEFAGISVTLGLRAIPNTFSLQLFAFVSGLAMFLIAVGTTLIALGRLP